jgi:hypothetical protein
LVTIQGNVLIGSDERLKSDIKPLSSEVGMLYRLEGKSYHKEIRNNTDSIDEAKGFPEKKRGKQPTVFEYGFLAQDVKIIFPELVEQDEEGYYSVNYISLIPVVVEALKEHQQIITAQSEKITELEVLVKNLVEKSSLRAGTEDNVTTAINTVVSDHVNAFLYQNAPNPFQAKTEIRYFLPQGILQAYLCIFDMQGQMLKKLDASVGDNTLMIQGSELQAGMYLYSLIADGKEVDTKRMILTK